MDHIYIYYVDDYEKTVSFEVQPYPIYENSYHDELDFESFQEFITEYADNAYAYRVHIDREDQDKLDNYFGYDILH